MYNIYSIHLYFFNYLLNKLFLDRHDGIKKSVDNFKSRMYCTVCMYIPAMSLCLGEEWVEVWVSKVHTDTGVARGPGGAASMSTSVPSITTYGGGTLEKNAIRSFFT